MNSIHSNMPTSAKFWKDLLRWSNPLKVSDWVMRRLIKEATKRSRLMINMMLPPPCFTEGLAWPRHQAAPFMFIMLQMQLLSFHLDHRVFKGISSRFKFHIFVLLFCSPSKLSLRFVKHSGAKNGPCFVCLFDCFLFCHKSDRYKWKSFHVASPRWASQPVSHHLRKSIKVSFWHKHKQYPSVIQITGYWHTGFIHNSSSSVLLIPKNLTNSEHILDHHILSTLPEM